MCEDRGEKATCTTPSSRSQSCQLSAKRSEGCDFSLLFLGSARFIFRRADSMHGIRSHAQRYNIYIMIIIMRPLLPSSCFILSLISQPAAIMHHLTLHSRTHSLSTFYLLAARLHTHITSSCLSPALFSSIVKTTMLKTRTQRL